MIPATNTFHVSRAVLHTQKWLKNNTVYYEQKIYLRRSRGHLLNGGLFVQFGELKVDVVMHLAGQSDDFFLLFLGVARPVLALLFQLLRAHFALFVGSQNGKCAQEGLAVHLPVQKKNAHDQKMGNEGKK